LGCHAFVVDTSKRALAAAIDDGHVHLKAGRAQVTRTIGRRVLEPLLDLINQPHLSVVMSSFYLEIHRKRVA
jgi:hypothetical protein